MSDNRITISKDREKDIQAYLDYVRIVGVDDGGKMMSEKEFEAYKKKVAEARRNHLYVYWTNIKGNDCKAIGPESMCFCGHRFKMHNFDNVKTKKVDCKDKKCKCPLFEYVPVHGSNDIKCLCKHSYSDHDNVKRCCTKPNCKCVEFGSKFTCNCTYTYDDHVTTIETREERMSRGKNVDPSWLCNNLTAGQGGLNSFASMVGDIQEMEYKKLMNDPKDMKMIADEFGKKMNLGGGEDYLGKDLSKTNLYQLFTTPNKWVSGSAGLDRKSNNYKQIEPIPKMGIGMDSDEINMSNKNTKMIGGNSKVIPSKYGKK